MKPFDAKLRVFTPDGKEVTINLNLLELEAKFACPLCDVIGEDEKISLLSLSDHLARHYVENNRAEEVKTVIAEDEKRKPAISNMELLQYERAVDPDYLPSLRPLQTQKFDDQVLKYNFGNNPAYEHTYYQHGLTEEEELRIAIAESMSAANTTDDTVDSVDTINTINTTDITYQPRRKKATE